MGYPHIALITIVQGVEIVILESPKCIRLLPIKVFLTFFSSSLFSSSYLSMTTLVEHSEAQPIVWKYGLWSFQTGGTKLERFLPKNQHTQIIEF